MFNFFFYYYDIRSLANALRVHWQTCLYYVVNICIFASPNWTNTIVRVSLKYLFLQVEKEGKNIKVTITLIITDIVTLSSVFSCLNLILNWKRRKLSVPIIGSSSTRQSACSCNRERLSKVISSSNSLENLRISFVEAPCPLLRICKKEIVQ